MSKKFGTQQDLFLHYQSRYLYDDNFQLPDSFSSESVFCVVIPCFNEPNLITTLQSLVDAQQTAKPVEVIVVINAPMNAPKDIQAQNQKSKSAFKEWVGTTRAERLKFHLIDAANLPQKKAGVGLARKMGMDEAFRQFAAQNRAGHIVCLDADCTVSPNYLVEAEQQIKPDIRGGHFQFEHRLNAVENETLRAGILQYELHLRYHNQGLKYTGFPFAEHTVGSCMIVRSDVYGQLGGMNQRKAGEDFYFMNKVYPGGRCITINNARVYPSARVSNRVPFGTGRAQNNWLKDTATEFRSYNPKIYGLLQSFFKAVAAFKSIELHEIDEILLPFLEKMDFFEKRNSVLKRSRNPDIFKKNFFQWFDAFQTLKLIHFLRETHLPNLPIGEAVAHFPNTPDHLRDGSLDMKLLYYRKLETTE